MGHAVAARHFADREHAEHFFRAFEFLPQRAREAALGIGAGDPERAPSVDGIVGAGMKFLAQKRMGTFRDDGKIEGAVALAILPDQCRPFDIDDVGDRGSKVKRDGCFAHRAVQRVEQVCAMDTEAGIVGPVVRIFEVEHRAVRRRAPEQPIDARALRCQVLEKPEFGEGDLSGRLEQEAGANGLGIGEAFEDFDLVPRPVQEQCRRLSADAATDYGDFHSVPTNSAGRAIHRADTFRQTSGKMTLDSFELDQRLALDTIAVTDWMLSRILLMNDRRFPWLILVPRRTGMTEVFDLAEQDRALLWREADAVARALKAMTGCRKINIGALGNVVSQLHVHVVARSEADAAWPGPVWGKGVAERYNDVEAASLLQQFKTLLRNPVD